MADSRHGVERRCPLQREKLVCNPPPRLYPPTGPSVPSLVRIVSPRGATFTIARFVAEAAGTGAIILDTRSAEEYYGELVRARRGGAVPGAVHVDWIRNLDAEGAFKPREDLRAMYEKAGVTPDREVVTYCQGGYRAAHSYLALRLLGYPRVRAYLGSWKEWGDREELPIEKPRRS